MGKNTSTVFLLSRESRLASPRDRGNLARHLNWLHARLLSYITTLHHYLGELPTMAPCCRRKSFPAGTTEGLSLSSAAGAVCRGTLTERNRNHAIMPNTFYVTLSHPNSLPWTSCRGSPPVTTLPCVTDLVLCVLLDSSLRYCGMLSSLSVSIRNLVSLLFPFFYRDCW